MTKNKTLSEKKYAGFCYQHEDVKECFDRIKIKLMYACENKADGLLMCQLVDEEIGDYLK